MRCPERRHAAGRAVVAVVLVSIWAGCERPVPGSEVRARLAEYERLNVVLLVVDTLRADRTTPYGGEDRLTPELQEWAARGVVFERVRSQSSWTKMSMASLMTSLWPHSHGITEADDGLGASAETLAEIFQQAGYSTFGVQTNGWLDQSFGFQQGFDRYLFPVNRDKARLPRASVWPHADHVVDEATNLIERRPKDPPFFLYLHFMDVHEYAAPSEFKRYGTGLEGDYHAAIRWTDDAIERVREALARAGDLQDTLIVLASDHAETFGEHGVYGHARNVFTPVVHVPLILRLPFRIDPVRVTTQVRNVDIAPTLLELAGIPVPDHFQGESLVPFIVGEAPNDGPDRPTFAALGTPLYPDASIQISTNDGAWTYARNVAPGPNRDEFLFDRRVDPAENVNLVSLEARQLDAMRKALDRHLSEGAEEGVRERGVRIDPGIAERLRAMGYLQ